jgi:hypothetical protein
LPATGIANRRYRESVCLKCLADGGDVMVRISERADVFRVRLIANQQCEAH